MSSLSRGGFGLRYLVLPNGVLIDNLVLAAGHRARCNIHLLALLTVVQLDDANSLPARIYRVLRCTFAPRMRASIRTCTTSFASPLNAAHTLCSRPTSSSLKEAGLGLFRGSGRVRGNRYRHGGGSFIWPIVVNLFGSAAIFGQGRAAAQSQSHMITPSTLCCLCIISALSRVWIPDQAL